MTRSERNDQRTGSRRLPWLLGSAEWAELAAPCDRHVSDPASRRAVRSRRTRAPADVLYLWLCQLRRAPYSYDWIDNLGRRSPRNPDPRLCTPSPGDRFMTIFTLVDVEPGRSLTLRLRPGPPTRLFGEVVLTYTIEERHGLRHLVAAIWFGRVGRLAPRLRRLLLVWGDAAMMDRQLRTLCQLAEASASSSSPAEPERGASPVDPGGPR